MRLFIGAGVLCLVSACLDEGERPQAKSVFTIHADAPGAWLCYVLTSVDATGKTWLAEGNPAASLPTRDAAVAAGQFCARGEGVHIAPCGPGLEHEVTLTITGAYVEDGTALAPEEFANPCPGDSCHLSFTCAADVDTHVDFHVAIMPVAKQGFFDISVVSEARHDISEMCVTLAVESGDGELTWRMDHLCTSQYGGGGSLTYIGTCDADAPTAKVRLWIESITSADPAAQFVNPCPAEGYDVDKACTLEATCDDNEDVTVEFELTLSQ